MDLTFDLVHVRRGHGADDYEDDRGVAYTLKATAGGVLVGSLDFNFKDKSLVWLRWIEVEPAFRRRGIASALMDEAERRFPGAEVDTGGFSDEGGEEFWAARYGGR